MTLSERINQLGGKPSDKPRPDVITVRLSPDMHQALKRIAWEQQISLNALCVASLEHAVGEFAPAVGARN